MSSSLSLMALIATCAPMVAHSTMAAVIKVESAENHFAIGVVNGKLKRQPKTEAEAIATVKELEKSGWNYSVGLAQVNKVHFRRYGLDERTYFDSCRNVQVGGQILQDCYLASRRFAASRQDNNYHLQRAFSCYYSGRLNSSAGRRYARQVIGAGH